MPLASRFSVEMPETKFIAPTVRNVIDRPALETRFGDAISKNPLTLVTAPAGSGKTTLVADYATNNKVVDIAWLRIDPQDNDLGRFIPAILEALNRVRPLTNANGTQILEQFDFSRAQIQSIVAKLINLIDEHFPGPVILVLDDLHHINSGDIYTTLQYLIEYIPDSLHLVLSSRHDPAISLERWRAQRKLVEIHFEDLALNLQEVATLFKSIYQINLLPEDLQALHQATQGWIAGLHIFALALRRYSADDSQVSSTWFSKAKQDSFEYFAAEILEQQSPRMRQFLLKTSVLEEMTPEKCRILTGEPESASLLRRLYQHGMFISISNPSDQEAVYRYHTLFQEFLRATSETETTSEDLRRLHTNAAQVEALSARKLHHYILAADWEAAAATLKQEGRALLRAGRLNYLLKKLQSLPEDQLARHGELLYFAGCSYYQKGDLASAQSVLEASLKAFDEGQNNEIYRAYTLYELAAVLFSRFDPQSTSYLESVIAEVLECPLPAHERLGVILTRAWVNLYHHHDWPRVDADVQSVIQEALASNDLQAFQVLAFHLNPPLAFSPSGYKALEGYWREMRARYGEGQGLVSLGAHASLSLVEVMRGQFDHARRFARRAAGISEQLGGSVFHDLNVSVSRLLVDLALGDYRAFDRHYEQGVSWIQQMDASRPSLPIYHAIRARALWLQNRTDELAEIDARMHLSEDLPEPPECRVVRRITAGIVALAKREIDQSIQILQQAAEMQSQMLPSLLYSDARILLAQIYHAQGAIPEAAEVLRDVLVEYRQKSFPGLLMKEGRYVVGLLEFAIRQGLEHRFAKEVLGKWERLQSLPKKVPETGEVITPRELEVLSLLAAGRSNRQIAAELVITERTVKSHITSLFRKLDVSSRTQAMARAHELQLVDY